jgi:hypothetical protein
MKTILMKNSIGYFVALLLIVSLGCSTIPSFGITPTPTLTFTPDFTPTPERLQLINDELEACLLITAAEVEAISGTEVTTEQGFDARENNLVRGPTSCRYLKPNGEVILATSANTSTTLARQGFNSLTSEWFQQTKMAETDMAEKLPTMLQLQDIDDLGEQAYVKMGVRIDINVLKSDIAYWFSTDTIEDGGMGYDALLRLARIALQRAP